MKTKQKNIDIIIRAEIMVQAIIEMNSVLNWKHLWQIITDTIEEEQRRNMRWYSVMHPLIALSKPQVKKYYLKYEKWN